MNRSNLFNVFHLTLSFFLIFLSYAVAQTFQTSSDHAKDGAFAIGIIYLVLCLTNLCISSYLLNLFGMKLSFILASITYGLFISQNIYSNRWTLFISAFLLGVGAALFWTAQGVYVTFSAANHENLNGLPTSSARGLVNGIFFSVYLLHHAAGNSIASLLFHFQFSTTFVFLVMTGFSAAGTLSLVFLRPLESSKPTEKRSIISSLKIIIELPFLFLVPTMLFGGLAQGFIFGSVPPIFHNPSLKFMVFAIFGCFGAVNSLVFGKISDLIQRRLVMFMLSGLAYGVIFLLFLTIWEIPFANDRWDIILTMIFCLSMGDTILTNQIYSTLGCFYQKTQTADAFAAFKLFQSGAIAIALIQQVYFSFSIRIWILMGFLIWSTLSLLIEHFKIQSLDEKSPQPDEIDVKQEIKTQLEPDDSVPLKLDIIS